MEARYFSEKLVRWYEEHKRPLPWRSTTDPYLIWLSEIIMQQTRVAQGLPYYEAFVRNFPRIEDLAAASEQSVLRLWQGLGYYTRARNLHKCARVVVDEHGGVFPRSAAELKKLPGIGPYTAAAIASFAFRERVAAVDGNAFRVLARVFGNEAPINSPAGQKSFFELANQLISEESPDVHNQAIMEFGATWCTPRNPRCTDCTFRNDCIAYRGNMVADLPVKLPGRRARKRYFFYLVIQKDRALLMKQRQEKDIWQGLFDFFLIETSRPSKVQTLMKDVAHRHWFKAANAIRVSPTYRHLLSHQEIHCTFIHMAVQRSFTSSDATLSFYTPREVAQLPKPALITRFLEEQYHE